LSSTRSVVPGGRIEWRNRAGPQDPILFALNLARTVFGALTSGSKDDIVGILVKPGDVGQTYTDANFAIANMGGTIEGRMKIVKY